MKLRIGIIGGIGAALLLALVVLAFKVHAEPAVKVPDRALARARRLHQRLARSHAPPPAPTPLRPIPPPPRRAPAPPHPTAPLPQRPQLSAPPRRPQLRRGARATGSEGAAAGAHAGLGGVRHAYDSGDYQQALRLASQYLARHPHQGYALRVAAAAACAVGDGAAARRYHNRMNAHDKRITATRCKRFGFTF